jgi:nucleotide-binding universal stress UspA family protein
MALPKSLLVAIDETEATQRTLDYVGALVSGREALAIHLAHVVGPPPEGLRAKPGAPGSEELLERQAAWMAEARDNARPLFDTARSGLERSGVAPACIEVTVIESMEVGEVAAAILQAARDLGCDTIVVGREAVSWVPQFFYPHVGEKVVKGATGLAVWVVG